MTTSVSELMIETGQKARAASRRMAAASTADKNNALLRLAELLEDKKEDIFAANKQDLVRAKKNGLKESFVDRLRVTEKVLRLMAEGARQTAALPDPVGEISEMRRRPSGIQVGRMRVPLGVLGIIYESRPNVTVDAACLAVKSGNACILRGGKEAHFTNAALTDLIRRVLKDCGLPEDAVISILDPDRQIVNRLLTLREYVDLVIPRGGAGLIRFVVDTSTVPVIETGSGVCHTYVDADADLEKAVPIIVNAKVQRPSVCNAMETLLIHRAVAEKFIPRLFPVLAEKQVELRGDDRVRTIWPSAVPAEEADWSTEYSALILSVKIVDSLEEAIDHIRRFSTGHSECIISENKESIRTFMNAVDAACVYANASTRFTDGFEFGFGAEIGISTQKLHVRGPVGLAPLVTYKYKIFGNGQIRG